MIQKLIIANVKEAAARVPKDSVIVTDHNVEKAWGSCFPACRFFSIEPGEMSKTWQAAGHLLERLVESGVTRKTTLVALGGGVIGDLAGFAASALLRGVPLLQIPTSLLAMVDSSIGGKVGVDLEGGKNLAGSFWPSEDIIVCPEFLSTLPVREWQCGAAEVWKYGAITDSALWESLLRQRLDPERTDLDSIIRACAEHKLRIVREDPYEKTGLRAILNFGHTVGHAIEWAFGYGALTHGEAIAIGMVCEARLGERLGISEPGTEKEILKGMLVQGLPTSVPDSLNDEDLLKAMARDKKADADGLAFSLLTRVGECKLVRGVSAAEAAGALRQT